MASHASLSIEATDAQAEWIKGLREVADWFEANPDRIPGYTGAHVILFEHYGESALDFMADMALRFGKAEKSGSDDYFFLRKHFGPHDIQATTSRGEVCERVQVGTEAVSEPDPVVLAAVPMVEVEKPVYKWECKPILGGSSDA